MGSPGVVVHAVPADLGVVADALTAAFADDPVQQWLFEEADDYRASLGRFFRFFVDEYFAMGHVYVLQDRAEHGAAMWAPPGREILHDDRRLTELIALMSAELGGDPTARLTELARASDYHPPEPHFYLGILGVAPVGQGAGLGQDLVAPILEMCDRAGTIAHLESSNPRNLGFYERLGFAATDEYRCGSEHGPLMTIMTRPPS